MSQIVHRIGNQYTLTFTAYKKGSQPLQVEPITGATPYFEVWTPDLQTRIFRKAGTVTSGANGRWQVKILSTELTRPGNFQCRRVYEFGNDDIITTDWDKLTVNV